MTTRLASPCRAPGCPNVAGRRGLCPACERQRDRQRPSAALRGYDRRWQQLRPLVLMRDPVCRAEGCRERSTNVDHIVPRAEGGGDDPSNLQGLCHEHHSGKTLREIRQRADDQG